MCDNSRPHCSFVGSMAKWDLRIYNRVSSELKLVREGVWFLEVQHLHIPPIAIVVDRSQRPAIQSPAGNVSKGVSDNLRSTFL
jgi:hypothetical protein